MKIKNKIHCFGSVVFVDPSSNVSKTLKAILGWMIVIKFRGENHPLLTFSPAHFYFGAWIIRFWQKRFPSINDPFPKFRCQSEGFFVRAQRGGTRIPLIWLGPSVAFALMGSSKSVQFRAPVELSLTFEKLRVCELETLLVLIIHFKISNWWFQAWWIQYVTNEKIGFEIVTNHDLWAGTMSLYKLRS